MTQRLSGSSQRIYLDTNVFIALIESPPERYPSLFNLMKNAGDVFQAFTGEITFGELLVKPYSENEALAQTYMELLTTASRLHVAPIDRGIFIRAAQLRSQRKGLKLPDAVHIATAEHLGCGIFLSQDKAIVPNAPMTRIGLAGAELDSLIESLA
jgi:predicted nucleic acid-binding protein